MKPSPFFLCAFVYGYIFINIVALFIQIKELCNHSYIPRIISGHPIVRCQNGNSYGLICFKEVEPSIATIEIVIAIIVDDCCLT